MAEVNLFTKLGDGAFTHPEGDVVLSDRITLKWLTWRCHVPTVTDNSWKTSPARLLTGNVVFSSERRADEERLCYAYMNPLFEKFDREVEALMTRIHQALLRRSRQMKHVERSMRHGRRFSC